MEQLEIRCEIFNTLWATTREVDKFLEENPIGSVFRIRDSKFKVSRISGDVVFVGPG